MTALLEDCRFNPTLGGTTDWTYSTAVTGYQSPTAAGAVNGLIYAYRAESADLSQWEEGEGAYNSGTGVFARTTVFYNSLGTTAKVSFSTVPQVAIILTKRNVLAIDESNIFTAAQRAQARSNISAVLRGQLWGLTLSTAGASSTFGVAAGEAADSTAADLMVLASAYTKTTAAWAVGTAAGSFDGTGSAPSATAGWYHVFLIKRPDTGVVDILTSNSATAPTLPTNYTIFRRIGSMKTDGSFHWLAFLQLGTSFYWQTAVTDASGLATNSTPANLTLAGVPTGVSVKPIMFVWANAGSAATSRVRLYSPLLSDNNAARVQSLCISSAAGNVSSTTINSEYTNTLAQLRYVNFSNDVGSSMDVYTMGWMDDLGKLA